MKKYFSAFLALLLVTGAAFAASIPGAVDPAAGPEVWLTDVYNNTGSTMNAGDVVVWDYPNTTDDDDNYVVLTSTADTHIVAGVVYPSAIASKKTGSIAVRGVVDVNVIDHLIAAHVNLCTGAESGKARACASETDMATFGYAVETGQNTAIKAFINL